jgi:hypothetical protein
LRVNRLSAHGAAANAAAAFAHVSLYKFIADHSRKQSVDALASLKSARNQEKFP